MPLVPTHEEFRKIIYDFPENILLWLEIQDYFFQI